MELQELYSGRIIDGLGETRVKILIGATYPVDIGNAVLNSIACDAGQSINEEMIAQAIAADPKSAIMAAKERKDILELFPTPIYVETIPNGYCPGSCCRHLPWFIITTTIGRFKIGWRKRVIHIEWTDTIVKATAENLFPQSNMTKSGRMIHAPSYADARFYIQTVIAAAS